MDEFAILSDLLRRMHTLETARRAGNTTVSDDSISVVDDSGRVVCEVGKVYGEGYGIHFHWESTFEADGIVSTDSVDRYQGGPFVVPNPGLDWIAETDEFGVTVYNRTLSPEPDVTVYEVIGGQLGNDTVGYLIVEHYTNTTYNVVV
jgi:hypothetical protein